jgi:transcriptional regulator of acetoin/glycerol metabolism
LERREQAALLKWLDTRAAQVISTTTHPLFPLIAGGLFDEALYYRLNVTLMRIDSTLPLA